MTYHPIYYASQGNDDAEYYRQQVEDLERQLDAEYKRQEAARESRLQARREAYEWSMRQADTWPEALEKQASLMGSEAYLDDPEGEYGEFDTYFRDGGAACRRALEVWREEEQAIAPEIEALQRQITALRDGVRLKVAAQVREEGNGRDGWLHVAGALEEYEEHPGALSAWLNW